MRPEKIILPREELYQKYIVENLSRKETANFFGISERSVKRKVAEFNFKKSQKQKALIISNSQKIFLNKDELYELYIIKNLSQIECAKKLNASPVVIKRRLKEFGIKKPQKEFKNIHSRCANTTTEVLKRRKNSVLFKYGVDNISKLRTVKKKKEKTFVNKYGVKNPFQSDEIKSKISNTVLKKYGVPYSCMREECRKYSGNDSKPNQCFADLLNSYQIKYEREFALGNYSYDFKVGKYLFEIDPTPFHNIDFSPVGKSKSKNYHLEKTDVASNNSFRCIHVFDWEDTDKIIKLFLINKKRCFARNCEIRPVDKQTALSFINENHLQGYAKDSVRLGLFLKGTDQLISIMTFDKPRYNAKYQYELVRFCTRLDVAVIGGAEKLFKAFLKLFNPKSVISYCDLSKFEGATYTKLGFTPQGKPQSSKHWVNLKTGQHITDNLLRQRGFDQLFHTHYGKGTSNEELMLRNGFVRVYDCGQLVYLWKSI